MCGINGIFAYRYAASAINSGELIRTRDHMATRGPDGAGKWISEDGRIGLGHRRLSIIDLSDAGAQPMKSADEALVIAFNGEIYNYRALRQALEAKGHVFRSQSDTEVLLHLYAEKGAAMVDDLRGMFAFAIWDRERRYLFLARDPYGIKPLYYADDGRTFRFASQVGALTAGGQVAKEADPAGWAGFFLFGSVPEPFTTWKAVRCLPAGSSLLVTTEGRRTVAQYHGIASEFHEAQAQANAPPSTEALQEGVRQALLESVRYHLVADVPVGAFLSGGVDSGSLVGLMRDAGQSDIQTVTLAFKEFDGLRENEALVASEVAERYQTRHMTRIVNGEEFRRELRPFLAAMDQPTIDGVNTWFVSKAARELGLKVAISGVGGDELFGGYPSFVDIPRSVRWLHKNPIGSSLPRSIRQLLSAVDLTGLGISPKFAALLELGGSYAGAYLLRRGLFLPWELPRVMNHDMARQGLDELDMPQSIEVCLKPDPGTVFGRVAALESSLYLRNQLLRDTDWTSMAHSLEVRTPLVDAVLLRQLAPFVHGLSKHNGKSLLRHGPHTPMPDSVARRAKTGFTVPMGAWIDSISELGDYTSKLPPREHWSRKWALVVSKIWSDQRAGLSGGRAAAGPLAG